MNNLTSNIDSLKQVSMTNWAPAAFKKRKRVNNGKPNHAIISLDLAKYYDFTSRGIGRAEWFWSWFGEDIPSDRIFEQSDSLKIKRENRASDTLNRHVKKYKLKKIKHAKGLSLPPKSNYNEVIHTSHDNNLYHNQNRRRHSIKSHVDHISPTLKNDNMDIDSHWEYHYKGFQSLDGAFEPDLDNVSENHNYFDNHIQSHIPGDDEYSNILDQKNLLVPGFRQINLETPNNHLKRDQTTALRKDKFNDETRNKYHLGEGRWSHPFIDCKLGKIWLVAYSVPIYLPDMQSKSEDNQYYVRGVSSFLSFLNAKKIKEMPYLWLPNGVQQTGTLVGVIAVMMDLRYLDANQCDNGTGLFAKTHLCDSSTQCVPIIKKGFTYGNYECKCKNAFNLHSAKDFSYGRDIDRFNNMNEKQAFRHKFNRLLNYGRSSLRKPPKILQSIEENADSYPEIRKGVLEFIADNYSSEFEALKGYENLSFNDSHETSPFPQINNFKDIKSTIRKAKMIDYTKEYYSLIPKSYYERDFNGIVIEKSFIRDFETILQNINTFINNQSKPALSLSSLPSDKYYRYLFNITNLLKYLYRDIEFGQTHLSPVQLYDPVRDTSIMVNLTHITQNLELGGMFPSQSLTNNSSRQEIKSIYKCFSCGDMKCLRCPGIACFAKYRIGLRGPPLAIQSFCMTLVLAMIILIFWTRKIKIISFAMWTLLEIILLGAFILYSTIIIDYFKPTTILCFIGPWFREVGFGLLYGAIILKLYKLYVDFQSRKAHRIHIRDKDLLKYLMGIIIVIIGYMAAWTFVNLDRISEEGGSMLEVGITKNNLIYYVCKSLWWDYVIEIGEFLFLIFGLYYSWKIRSVRSHLSEVWALKTSLCIEAFVSVIMNLLKHLTVLNTHSDYIFLMFFFRIQCTVTIVLLLIFFPKIWRLMNLKSHGDRRSRGISGAEALDHITPEGIKLRDNLTSNGDLDFNDISLTDMDPEEIRSELKRVYMQLQMLKNKNLRKDNPHISKRRGGRKAAHSRRFSLQAFHHHNPSTQLNTHNNENKPGENYIKSSFTGSKYAKNKSILASNPQQDALLSYHDTATSSLAHFNRNKSSPPLCFNKINEENEDILEGLGDNDQQSKQVSTTKALPHKPEKFSSLYKLVLPSASQSKTNSLKIPLSSTFDELSSTAINEDANTTTTTTTNNTTTSNSNIHATSSSSPNNNHILEVSNSTDKKKGSVKFKFKDRNSDDKHCGSIPHKKSLSIRAYERAKMGILSGIIKKNYGDNFSSFNNLDNNARIKKGYKTKCKHNNKRRSKNTSLSETFQSNNSDMSKTPESSINSG
ncbi:uncharacterized protein LOC135927898 [Gordionus sp. m RMFG-2023]|uniref:uncharacterized protein LOC135927898 n=1 Tax=Gordionus sp. m RMFG-2023 TaxID=3053472 RepID=UPI0031FE0929